MSDNFKVLGIGGAGVNVVKSLGYKNSVYIDSFRFDSPEGVEDFLRQGGKDERVVIVSSPAGEFSSKVLKSVCRALNSQGDRIFLIGIMPFHSESPERKKRGDLVLRDLRRDVDSTAIVENENFASSMREYPWTQVLARVNEHVGSLVAGFVSKMDEISAGDPEIADARQQMGYAPKTSASLN
jgi:cell division GTPase FtsZ